MTDELSCLECAKKPGNIHEFVGPVKIRLVDIPPGEYLWRRIYAGLITLAYLLMGATVMTVLFFTLSFKLPFLVNAHVLLCTCGYQLCIPSGILILDKLNNSSNVLRLSDRKTEHFFTQSFGFAIAIAGSFFMYLANNNKLTVHSFTGLTAGMFGLLNILLGPIILYFDHEKSVRTLKKLHVAFGGLCFLTSSLCFIHGIVRPCMYNWVPVQSMVMFMFLFCVYYTIVVTRRVLQSYSDLH